MSPRPHPRPHLRPHPRPHPRPHSHPHPISSRTHRCSSQTCFVIIVKGGEIFEKQVWDEQRCVPDEIG